MHLSNYPETQHSLLVRIRDSGNREAWEQFAELYRPVIVRTAKARGLQEADALDLAQQVLMAVALAIRDWERRDEGTRFRHWLKRVTRNALLNMLTRRPVGRAVGGSSMQEWLLDMSEPDGEITAVIETEYRREMYLRAAQIVRREFHAESWQAFEMSVFQEMSIEEVATSLAKSVGAIYTARSRIMFRLRQLITEFEEQEL